ncbi:MAG: hypothetical protein OXE05_12195 [Chloroflexi bacterium]|nr:hypothetical protein [Chloroflexota bacterium]
MAAVESEKQEPPSDAQLRREVQAMVAAHQELGERFGTELADSFVERLHATIDQRIEARIKNRKGSASPLVLPVLSLFAGLPAMAIAGAAMGGFASPLVILSPWIAIIILNVIWAVGRRD